MLQTDPDGERFDAEFRALRAGVEHHAGEEERQMFPETAALGDAALAELGARLASRRDALRRSPLAQARIAIERAVLRHL